MRNVYPDMGLPVLPALFLRQQAENLAKAGPLRYTELNSTT